MDEARSALQGVRARRDEEPSNAGGSPCTAFDPSGDGPVLLPLPTAPAGVEEGPPRPARCPDPTARGLAGGSPGTCASPVGRRPSAPGAQACSGTSFPHRAAKEAKPSARGRDPVRVRWWSPFQPPPAPTCRRLCPRATVPVGSAPGSACGPGRSPRAPLTIRPEPWLITASRAVPRAPRRAVWSRSSARRAWSPTGAATLPGCRRCRTGTAAPRCFEPSPKPTSRPVHGSAVRPGRGRSRPPPVGRRRPPG